MRRSSRIRPKQRPIGGFLFEHQSLCASDEHSDDDFEL